MFKKMVGILSIGIVSLVLSYSFIVPVRAAVDKTYEQLRLLIDVMGLIDANYVEEKNNKDLITGAINGMVRALDPFSQFLEPDAYKEMKSETEGEFGGIGIRISLKNDWLTVMTPLPGTPAYKAGILPEDKIIKVDNKNIYRITIENAIKLLRGAPGTKVTLSVAREGEKEPIDYTLTREIIKIETVRSKMIDSEIGYIQLIEFTAKSEKDLIKALLQLKKEGLKSLVLDLRNNPGGLLDSAIDVSQDFLEEGKLVVYTQGREKETRRDYFSRGKSEFAKLPIVVLVNRGSASGSEIVAGAMQDLKRGLIVGTTTFGKGSVQSIFPFADGYALRLTTAKYYTPLGRSIHRDENTGVGGIIPDIVIDVPRDIESKLYKQSEKIFVKGKEPQSAVKKEELVEDVVLKKAIELIKNRKVL
ncbi:MAG: S41 family peptidase [Elusimicrobia bacterium]|nr:S41 family peptidase [Elusimicrobiota bacterium]